MRASRFSSAFNEEQGTVALPAPATLPPFWVVRDIPDREEFRDD
jgi:hypothetical protein